MTIEAKVIADSVSNEGIRLTTMQLKYPRFIHSEMMTHRVFSRNASSSRAIPVSKQIEMIREEPALPIYWGSNKPGMQAGEELEGENLEKVKDEWLFHRDRAINSVRVLIDRGLHKQLANRLLEPWSHIHVVVTATEWDNFYALRRHPDAQPEMHALADAMWEAQQASTPYALEVGDWHLPYVDIEDEELNDYSNNAYNQGLEKSVMSIPLKCSVARCARVSYVKHDGQTPSIKDDLTLYDRLVSRHPIHASPAEHQATPDVLLNPAGLHSSNPPNAWQSPMAHGNFNGWVQYRKTLDNENITDYTESEE